MADPHRLSGGDDTAVPPSTTAPPPKPSYANALNAKSPHNSWFRLQPIPLAQRTAMFKDNKPAIIVSSMEIEQSAKQFEFALVMKFTSGRPSLHDIKNHVNSTWNLSKEPVMSLVDARHVFMILASKEDMVRAQTHASHRINSSLFRLFRWHKDFDYKKDSPLVPVWVTLPKLPIPLINPAVLERIGNAIGTFLRIDERTMSMTHTMATRICVEVDLSKDFLDEIWIGDSTKEGYWQSIMYEGNVSFCSHCGLLGHVKGVCRKLPTISMKEVAPKYILTRPQEERNLDKGKNIQETSKSAESNIFDAFTSKCQSKAQYSPAQKNQGQIVGKQV
ncbi:hypothetical protein CASFOL_009218 [Castilleja foliolosa]|uniref:DUF4283 domain-containing protein n=1 Tax=Castilleja foliolosa TaxID=1961234 RepID=A0ABD3E0W3_9LAMI